MDTVWQKLKVTGFNTVLGCVTWENIEPVEGEFHFSELETAKGASNPITKIFGDFRVTIERYFVFGKAGPGAGMVINTAPGRFLLTGWGFQTVFKSNKHAFTGFFLGGEKSVVDAKEGTLRSERNLNGDETRSRIYCMMPNEDPDYGGFPNYVTIPARTIITKVEVYSITINGEDRVES